MGRFYRSDKSRHVPGSGLGLSLVSAIDRGFKVALLTDGRMSGASGKVPAAIHVGPEAQVGGPIDRQWALAANASIHERVRNLLSFLLMLQIGCRILRCNCYYDVIKYNL